MKINSLKEFTTFYSLYGITSHSNSTWHKCIVNSKKFEKGDKQKIGNVYALRRIFFLTW